MDYKSEQLIVLEKHRANMAGAKTFEEYQAQQVSYIDLLIERQKTIDAKADVTAKWVLSDHPTATDK